MKNNQIAIIKPTKTCPFCKSNRIGIQEGLVFYACGTILDYKNAQQTKEIAKNVTVKRSSKCQTG